MIPLKNTILETIALLRPNRVLDAGCGCGSFTAQLSEYIGEITAIDISPVIIERGKRENSRPNIIYQCMDSTRLSFPDGCFDIALERESLHHIDKWQEALTEMIRVSSKYIFLEEPLDDLRSDAKRRTYSAQGLFLEIQKEAGYQHYRHLGIEELLTFFGNAGLPYEFNVTKSDMIIGLDEFFDPLPLFAKKTPRPDYWMNRLTEFKESLSGTTLCKSDTLIIVAEKGGL